MAKKTKSNYVTLACSACKNRNYYIGKSHMLRTKGKGVAVKLAMSKFCSTCRSHTDHSETK